MAGAGKAVRGRAASADGCVLDQMAVTICCWSLSHPCCIFSTQLQLGVCSESIGFRDAGRLLSRAGRLLSRAGRLYRDAGRLSRNAGRLLDSEFFLGSEKFSTHHLMQCKMHTATES